MFSGLNTQNQQKVCIKLLKPVRKFKILREVKILQILYGGPNIVSLHDVARDRASKTPCLVFEYLANANSTVAAVFKIFQDLDCRYYMFQLLLALDYAHSNGIMHRDVKPQNIMFDCVNKKFRLIDWGLAEFYVPNQTYNVRVATRFYKSPELLVEDTNYHYALDIWSAGCTLAEMIFKTGHPLFRGQDNLDQLLVISKIMGTSDLIKSMQKYNILMSPFFQQNLGQQPKVPFSTYVNNENASCCHPEAIDLLEKMLKYDKNERITAKEALNHPYFEQLREQLAYKFNDDIPKR